MANHSRRAILEDALCGALLAEDQEHPPAACGESPAWPHAAIVGQNRTDKAPLCRDRAAPQVLAGRFGSTRASEGAWDLCHGLLGPLETAELGGLLPGSDESARLWIRRALSERRRRPLTSQGLVPIKPHVQD
jgi:hypothetical protein